MTDELTKTFFDTFEIGPFYKAEQCDGWCRTVEVRYFTNKEDAKKFGIVFGDNPQYPEITDSILLKLICILAKITDEQCCEPYKVFVYNYEDLKELVLDDCSLYKEQIKQQVQALFKEDN